MEESQIDKRQKDNKHETKNWQFDGVQLIRAHFGVKSQNCKKNYQIIAKQSHGVDASNQIIFHAEILWEPLWIHIPPSKDPAPTFHHHNREGGLAGRAV